MSGRLSGTACSGLLLGGRIPRRLLRAGLPAGTFPGGRRDLERPSETLVQGDRSQGHRSKGVGDRLGSLGEV